MQVPKTKMPRFWETDNLFRMTVLRVRRMSRELDGARHAHLVSWFLKIDDGLWFWNSLLLVQAELLFFFSNI